MTEDFDVDRFADVGHALTEIQEQPEFPLGAVERLEVHFQQSGEVTWRAWHPHLEDPVGGYIGPDVLPNVGEDS